MIIYNKRGYKTAWNTSHWFLKDGYVIFDAALIVLPMGHSSEGLIFHSANTPSIEYQ